MSDEIDSIAYFKRREEELVKLNAKLEEQKIAALQSAQEAVKVAQQDINIKRTPFTPLSPANILKPEETTTPQEPTFPGVTLGASMSHLENMQSTVRYQKARVQSLQEELDKVTRTNRDRDAEMTALRQELRNVQEENKKWFKKANNADTDIDKIARKATNSESAMKQAEDELADLRRQRDLDQSVIKKIEAESKAKDVKLNRLLEENDRLKSSLREAKSTERDKVTVEKEVADKLTADIKRLTKQRNELINVFKKHAKLIDILRRQKTHLEAARMLNFTEDEFVTALKLDEKLQ